MEIDLRPDRYALTPERAEELMGNLQPRLVPSPNGFALLELDGNAPESDLCRVLEQQVFDRAFGDIVHHSPDMMAAEYGPYEHRCTFFAMFECETARLAGMVRVIDGFPNKTVADLARGGRLTIDLMASRFEMYAGTTRDLGTVAVDEAFRGTMGENIVAASLCKGVYVASLRDGIRHWTGVIDSRVLADWQRIGIPFERLDDVEDFIYLGSFARACFLDVDNVRTSMEAAAHASAPELCEVILGFLNGSDLLCELSDAVPVGRQATIDLRSVETQAVSRTPES